MSLVETPEQSSSSATYPRSTVATTWRWLWPDVLIRVVPLTGIPLLWLVLWHRSPAELGLTLPPAPGTQLALGLGLGSLMALLAMLYRALIVGRGFRRPSPGDHLLQAFYYLFINAPAEELFFRGFLLHLIWQWTGWPAWGWLVSTLVYTLYHRLGGWNWRSIAGVGLAGMVFSTLYLLQPAPPSLLSVILVHGLTTCGFLSWGDEFLYIVVSSSQHPQADRPPSNTSKNQRRARRRGPRR
ncbi:CPBP family intramembrane glutamic endopeptidase [Thermogemmatispora sp.]|uniref:CPBP family intramembrane glutamic endopeptidase n=1 Tax=Thermogemmatispora sp. TaxID=1968838 RepID=UPI0035E4484A